MTATWKTVRVFISSTFRDMHAERDHLVKVTFPRLRQWCEQRRLHLVDIDLRWGVTKEEADNGKAIDICLEEIDSSRPFFLCILGNRYGWVPDELPPEELYRFHGLQADTHLSITHLEIVHATQEPVPTLEGSVQPTCLHAFFYLRKPECLPDPASFSVTSVDQQREYEITYFEQLADRTRMLDELKDDIRQRFADEDRVFEYSGHWDYEAENPEETALVGRLTRLDEFGRRVEADLKRGIREQFAEHIVRLNEEPDPLEDERSHHEAFIENRTQVHVPRSDVEKQLNDYVTGDELRPLVLSGPPGSGKSAILANWTRMRQSLAPDEFLVARFVGASPASTNLHQLLGNLSKELIHHFNLTEEVEFEFPVGGTTMSERVMQVPDDVAERQQAWHRILAAAGAKGRIVLVVDALNQLDRSADPATSMWLPRNLPPGVRLIVSVLDHAITPDQSDQRPARESTDWLTMLRQQGVASMVDGTELPVPELTDHDRETLIRQLPSVFCKSLSNDQVQRLLGNQATRNPLYLIVALEELRVFGSFEQLNDRIGQLPSLADSAGDVEAILHLLFGQVLERLERETKRQAPGLVPSLFKILASARDGMSEQELDEVLELQLPDVAHRDRQSTLQLVLRQIRPYLMRKGVLVDFYHRSFWKAACSRYLADDSARCDAHHDLATYFRRQLLYLDEAGSQGVRHGVLRPNIRKLTELPWQQTNAKAWNDLSNTLSDFQFIEAKCKAQMTHELLGDFQRAQNLGPEQWPGRAVIDDFQQFVSRCSNVLRSYPQLTFQEGANQPDHSAVASRALDRWRADKVPHNWLRWINKPQRNEGCSMVFTGHAAAVSTCDSVDDELVLSGDEDGRLLLWQTRSGEQLLELKGHSDLISCCRFLNDGRTIASSSYDGTIRLWDRRTGQCLHVLRGHADWVLCLDATLGGTMLVSGGGYMDGTVRVWDVESGAERFVWSLGEEAVKLCRASFADPICIVGGDSGSLKKWHLKTGELLHEARGTEAAIECWDFAVDESCFITGTGDGQLIRRDLATFAPIASVEAHDGGVSCCRFLPNESHLVSGGRDKTVKVWGVRTLELESKHQGYGKSITWCWGLDDNRHVVSADRDGTLRVEQVDAAETARVVPAHTKAITCAKAIGVNQFVTGSADHSLRIWSLDHSHSAAAVARHQGSVTCCHLRPDDAGVLSGASDGSLRIWPFESGTHGREFARCAGEIVGCLWLASTGGCVSATRDGKLQFWDSVGVLQNTAKSLTKGIVALAGSADENLIAVAGVDTRLVLWDTRLRQVRHVIMVHDSLPRSQITSCAFTPDSSHIWVAHKTDLIRFNVRTGQLVSQLTICDTAISHCAVMPGEDALFLGFADGVICRFSSSEGVVARTTGLHSQQITAICPTTASGLTLSVARDGILNVWDSNSFDVKAKWVMEQPITTAGWRRDGRFLVAGTARGEILLFEMMMPGDTGS